MTANKSELVMLKIEFRCTRKFGASELTAYDAVKTLKCSGS